MKKKTSFINYNRLNQFYMGVKSVCLVVITLVFLVSAVTLFPTLKRVDKASKELLDCSYDITGGVSPTIPKGLSGFYIQPNTTCIQSQIDSVSYAVRDIARTVDYSAKLLDFAVANYLPGVVNDIQNVTRANIQAANAAIEVTKNVNTLLQHTTNTVDELHATVVDLNTSIREITADSDVLLKSGNEVAQKTGLVMVSLDKLSKTLDEQIKTQSPEIGNTLRAMQNLLDDPALYDTIKHIDATSINVEEGTKNAAEVLKTADIATRDFRKKAGRVKWLILKLIDATRIVVPIF